MDIAITGYCLCEGLGVFDELICSLLYCRELTLEIIEFGIIGSWFGIGTRVGTRADKYKPYILLESPILLVTAKGVLREI